GPPGAGRRTAARAAPPPGPGDPEPGGGGPRSTPSGNGATLRPVDPPTSADPLPRSRPQSLQSQYPAAGRPRLGLSLAAAPALGAQRGPRNLRKATVGGARQTAYRGSGRHDA